MEQTPTRVTFSAQWLTDLLAASPEGFFNRAELDAQRLGAGSRGKAIHQAVADGKAGKVGNVIYDPARLTAEQVRERCLLFVGAVPQTSVIDGAITVPSVAQRKADRDTQLASINDPILRRLIDAFEGTLGFLPKDDLIRLPEDEKALDNLVGMNMLKRADDLIFDPLRITRSSINMMQKRQSLAPTVAEITERLNGLPGNTITRVDLVEKYGSKTLQAIVDSGGLVTFSVPTPQGDAVWVRLSDADEDTAYQVALAESQPKDEDWQNALDYCGDVMRPDAPDGDTRKAQVIVRSYTIPQAAVALGVQKETLQNAISSRQVIAFVDPEMLTRIPAYEVIDIANNPDWLDALYDMELVRLRELQVALNEPREQNILQRLRRVRANGTGKWRWGQIKTLLFPEDMTYPEFRDVYRQRKEAWLQAHEEKRAEQKRQQDETRLKERERREEERRQKDALRARLLAAFPTWSHAGRSDQRIIFHVGPPNSGKTHNALDRLAQASEGWYLAPLRLLAFEVFDRLNKRGVPCNLLTGEEYIPIPGARITAATIEMFNPQHSGEVVVIDEAQMLADPDRGWAWTRALMEAEAPEIYVIGPPHAQSLIESLAQAAQLPLDIADHQRLAPLEVAKRPWSLQSLPPRTIVVAFSRSMVLRLKTELENYRRNVSVVYGNLPPEVRRKQADRFAEGTTEICVATDAVGMGLNLPADRVCFFELSKFDGRENRVLTPSEVHQIAGRAGRYGLSQAGEVGATTNRDLKTLRSLYAQPSEVLTHARVAPDVEDLELLPGSLSRRFAQWRELQSIPDSLRNVIRPADIDERIALAQMLSDREVEQLGLATAVQLVNAPTRETSRTYWHTCARSILRGDAMPLPPEAPWVIENNHDLDATEASIACADIYLWLACRPEFSAYGKEEPKVREVRLAWSMSIDAALVRRVDTAARCISCHRKLPLNHRYTLCDECFHSRGSYWYR